MKLFYDLIKPDHLVKAFRAGYEAAQRECRSIPRPAGKGQRVTTKKGKQTEIMLYFTPTKIR